jgi:hypothetical protein
LKCVGDAVGSANPTGIAGSDILFGHRRLHDNGGTSVFNVGYGYAPHGHREPGAETGQKGKKDLGKLIFTVIVYKDRWRH